MFSNKTMYLNLLIYFWWEQMYVYFCLLEKAVECSQVSIHPSIHIFEPNFEKICKRKCKLISNFLLFCFLMCKLKMFTKTGGWKPTFCVWVWVVFDSETLMSEKTVLVYFEWSEVLGEVVVLLTLFGLQSCAYKSVVVYGLMCCCVCSCKPSQGLCPLRYPHHCVFAHHLI